MFTNVPANIPDAFEIDATDQISIMMSLRRFDRKGAKDYEIQMDKTVQLTASSHKWNFYHSASKYSPEGRMEEFTIELQRDDCMKRSFSWFIKVNASLIFLSQGKDGTAFEKNMLENDNEIEIVVNVGLKVVNSSGFRNRSRITYDFTTRNENSDLKLVFFGGDCIYIDSGYISHLSSYFETLRRRLSELPRDFGFPFETFSDINREEFVTLLRVVYPSKEKINDENVTFLLPLADRFLFEGLLGEIEKYLMNSEMDIVLKLEYATTYQMAGLQSDIFCQLSTRASLHNGRPGILKLKDSPHYNNLSADVMVFLFKYLMDNDLADLSRPPEKLNMDSVRKQGNLRLLSSRGSEVTDGLLARGRARQIQRNNNNDDNHNGGLRRVRSISK